MQRTRKLDLFGIRPKMKKNKTVNYYQIGTENIEQIHSN